VNQKKTDECRSVGLVVILDDYLPSWSVTAQPCCVFRAFDRDDQAHGTRDQQLPLYVNVVYDDKLDVTPQTTTHDVIVCISKSEAEVTNNKRRPSTYRTVEANYRQTRSVARSLCNCWASCFTSCTHPLTQCHCSLLYTFYQACSHCVAKHSVMMQCIHIRLVEFCILQQYYSILTCYWRFSICLHGWWV